MTITPLNVCGVSPQNKFEIIKYLLSSSAHSRNETAEALSLSSVTVGKVAAALLERKILISESLSGQRGRSTEMLCANTSLCVLLIFLEENYFRASLIGLDGIERTFLSRRMNDSMIYEEDLRIFIASLGRMTDALPYDDIISIIVVNGQNEPIIKFSEIEQLLANRLDSLTDRKTALSEYFSSIKNEIVLYIGISERISYELYAGGHFLSQGATGRKLESKDDYAVALEIANGLSSLFEFIVPTKIAISSKVITIDNKFVELISQKLSRNKFQTEIDIPTFIDEKDISLIGKAVLVSSLELFAKRLAGIE